jgi:hypothetical protein
MKLWVPEEVLYRVPIFQASGIQFNLKEKEQKPSFILAFRSKLFSGLTCFKGCISSKNLGFKCLPDLEIFGYRIAARRVMSG